MSFRVPVERAVSKLSNRVTFLQPAYEAIANSLEAGADDIRLSFDVSRESPLEDESGELVPRKIISFTIEDNGSGFTENSRNSFGYLWSDYKINLGCKGVGRVTWLKVFSQVCIDSVAGQEKTHIDYDLNFDPENISVEACGGDVEQKTIIKFQTVSDLFYTVGKDAIDKREDAILDDVQEKIQEYLLVKLSLLTQRERKFTITLSMLDKEAVIDSESIPELLDKRFQVLDINGKVHDFSLLYHFSPDSRGKVSLFYCANGRTVRKISRTISLKSLPNDDSAIMLLTSEYLDERVNDERNELSIGTLENDRTLDSPLAMQDINAELRTCIENIIVNKYPETVAQNEEVIDSCLDEYPHLAKYIKQDSAVVKVKADIIKSAKREFSKEKDDVRARFVQLLRQNEVDDTQFYQAVADIQEISARELAEYIVYRQQIIQALEELVEDNEKREALLHNIFMPMRTQENRGDDEEIASLTNNIWLLDDKFMTYSFAASDRTIRSICEEIESRGKKLYQGLIRPDLTVFYSSKSQDSKDVVVIEFKGVGASREEKNKALWELPRNIDVLRKNIPNISRIWAYIITQIDDEFADMLGADGYDRLFSNEENSLFYKYQLNKNNNTGAHIHVVSVESIIEDSKARNSVFLDIVRNQA